MPLSDNPTTGPTEDQAKQTIPSTPPTRTSILEGLTKAIDLGKSGIDSVMEGSREHLRMVVSFYDKLVILNGGTLAITFSALFAFHSANPKGRIDTADLFIAWKLLIGSIVGALLCSWLNISAVSVQAKSIEQTMLNFALVISTMTIKTAIPNAELDPQSLMPTEKQKKEAAQTLTSTRWIGNAARWIGAVSKLATAVAYYFLYRFARASASGL